MTKKKRIILYSSLTLVVAISFWFLYTKFHQENGYNLSQPGVLENKGQFIPEQRTDYIFTTITNPKKEFNDNFKNTIIGYQKLYPIPNSKKTKHRTYVYSAVFYKENNDTLFYLVRTSTGTDKESNFWGIYSDEILKPTIIGDDENLTEKLVFNKKRNKGLEKFYFYDKDGQEGFPPIHRYLIKDRNITLMKVDILSQKWEK